MMMAGAVLVASLVMRSSTAITVVSRSPPQQHHAAVRLLAAASSSSSSDSSSVMAAALRGGISRLSTLQTLLNKYGAPGSRGCTEADDLRPVVAFEDTPELVGSLVGETNAELSNLHPHLFPISKSSTTGNYICALRRAYADDASYESSTDAPWPIVEARPGGPGMQLLALNSEHLMRRIACESDFAGDGNELVALYNDGLGKGLLNEAALDAVYEAGSVEALGYGVDRYILLRVGPFPQLYERMAAQHLARGDHQSALIAAEACNGKFIGFGSTFKHQAKLLSSLPKREEESRDAARMCLRMPIPSIGMTTDDLREVAILAQLVDEGASEEEALTALRDMYERIRENDREDDASSSMTPEQSAFEEANYLLDKIALTGKGTWSEIRPRLGEIYRSVGRSDMADFVDPKVV